MAEDCGLPRTLHTVLSFNSRCHHIHMVRKRIVEDVCSIHTAANVSRRILLNGVFGGPQVRPALPPSAARVLLAPFWSGPSACSVARADTGRTQRPATSATAERPCRRRASAYGAQATLSGCMNRKIRSFRTSLGHRGLFFDLRCLNVSLAFSSNPVASLPGYERLDVKKRDRERHCLFRCGVFMAGLVPLFLGIGPMAGWRKRTNLRAGA